MPDTTLTWLGHAAFRMDTAGGKRIYVDPFLNGNPKCPEKEQTPERVDIIALTHGHGDHVGDTVDLVKQHGCTVVALVELSGWLGRQGVDGAMLQAPNKGGTVDVDGVKFTLTNAFHSGSAPDRGRNALLALAGAAELVASHHDPAGADQLGEPVDLV